MLHRISELPTAAAQRARYRAACVQSAPTSREPRRQSDAPPPTTPRYDDFQLHLDPTRRNQRWLDEGVYALLASIGRAEGLTGARVGQLLPLLHLDTAIVAALERPWDVLPRGLAD